MAQNIIVKLESVNGTTLVTVIKNGKTKTFSSSENRSLVIVENNRLSGVRILPHTEEKILTNFLIPVGSVEGFTATTPLELLKEIREKNLFKYGGGLGNSTDVNDKIDAYAELIGDFTFNVVANSYPVNDVFYTTNEDQVIVDAPDATHNRIDVIVADVNGVISLIKGQPSAAPIRPNYNISTQYPVDWILVPARAENLSGNTTSKIIFNEAAPTEFVLSTDFANVVVSETEASSGTKAIEVTNNNTATAIVLTDNEDTNLSVVHKLNFKIKLKETFSKSHRIGIAFVDGINKVATVSFTNGQFGYDHTSLDWQHIIIPSSNFEAVPSSTFNEIRIHKDFSSLGFYIDEISYTTNAIGALPTVKEYTSQFINDGDDKENPFKSIEKFEENHDVGANFEIDWKKDTFCLEMTSDTVFTESNLPTSAKNTKELKLYLKGDFTPTFPAAWLVNSMGTYRGTDLNEISIKFIKAGLYFVKISNSLSVYPAPILGTITPVSVIPNSTGEVIVSGSFYTPKGFVLIDGQVVNSIEFDANTGNYILSVTAGAIEGDFNITISNGTSVTFNGRFIVNLGAVYIPSEADWLNTTGSIDLSQRGKAKITTFGSLGTSFWNQELDYTKNWLVRLKFKKSALAWTTSVGFNKEIKLCKVSDDSGVFYCEQNFLNPSTIQLRVRGTGGGNVNIVNDPASTHEETFENSIDNKELEFRYNATTKVIESYYEGVLKDSRNSALTENVRLRVNLKYSDVVDIKYIELP